MRRWVGHPHPAPSLKFGQILNNFIAELGARQEINQRQGGEPAIKVLSVGTHVEDELKEMAMSVKEPLRDLLGAC